MRKIGNGLDLVNQRIQNLGTPSADSDAANKSYVDSVARGLDWKASVRAASVGNIDLSAPGANLDGVAMAANDRFLAKDQTDGSQNGIYVWNGAATPATRAIDADSDAEVTSGLATSVSEGTVNSDTTWVLTTDDPIVLDTTVLVFSPLGGGSTPYTAGNGLSLTGQEFNVGAGTGISVDATNVNIDTAVVVRKYAVAIGDGATTALVVTHNLGTRDVTVGVYEAGSPYAEILADVEHTDANTVTVTFATAPTAGQYRVVVHG